MMMMVIRRFSFKRGDKNYEKMREANHEFETKAPNGFPSDILPILGYVFYKQETSAREAIKKAQEVTDEMFSQAKGSWTLGA